MNYLSALFVFPARNPEPVLVSLIASLAHALQDATFIVVDDGSDAPSAKGIFETLSKMENLSLIVHAQNLGKGAALKTAISEALRRGASMIVTADADGQHAAADIQRVAEIAGRSDQMTIGARQFGPEVPFRSRFGNLLTRWIFNMLSRNKVMDTQSGLRAIPARFYEPLLAVSVDRYDFEAEALLLMTRAEPAIEIPIQTIYEPGNPTSFFNPIWDSARIYYVLLRYTATVPAIAFLDLAAFWMASLVLPTTAAFVIVRLATAGIYFVAMRTAVFRSDLSVGPQILKFLALCLINIVIATTILRYATLQLGMSAISGYLFSSILMLALNFIIMKRAIFATERDGPSKS